MSIPPAVGLGIGVTAALGVARLAAGAATELAENSTEAVTNFAEVFAADAGANKATETAHGPDHKTANKSLRQVIADLMTQLGLTSDSPVELQMDDQGQIQVTTPRPESSSPADAATRTQLQSVINGNEELRSKLASYFA
ncbi:hypothetical protein [Neorhodopirellula pilleata]|uniref:Uncharacterized protein n=1 Tax=Neorhodopirellula pilleata TaxID=2714738 RepID=A0A5C6AR53_9BACT|nr:hypothetical protein [Neorhodopirellula pilleata]TWU01977.1 hypothetical protein Pla100_17130 [Neorhodopirellula pilleata]